MELEADSGGTGAYSESHRLAQREGGDADSRAIKCSVHKSMLYGSEEEWVTPIYRRLATGEQGHNPELGVGLIVDEFAEAFAGRAIYSIGDLYSRYDQFQLVVESRDITTMRTPIGLVRMCTMSWT